MPITPPQLDDLRYSRVVEELVRRIPVYAPQWTDHNDSDPGIALLQLYAYLAEQIGYRLNRVPDKAHVALLALLGVRLQAARAATSQAAFFLSQPRSLPGALLPARSTLTRREAAPVVYETDRDLELAPAQVATWMSTRNPFLDDLLRLDEIGAREPEPTDSELPPELPAQDSPWLTVAWDGDKPQAKEIPLAPVALVPASDDGEPRPWLWLGLNFNDARDAGFLGVEVTLHVVLDDDELPSAEATLECAPVRAAAQPAPVPITWLSYFDADSGRLRRVPGRIIDSTERLSRSGTLRFTVPFTLGAPASWADLRAPVETTAPDRCVDLTSALASSLNMSGTFDAAAFQQALADAVDAAQAEVVTPQPAVPHPLDPKLRDPATANGWLRIGPLDEDQAPLRVRHLGFNVVGITHATTVSNEILGVADGRPGQRFRLAHQDVLAGTLALEIAESAEAGALLTPWTEVASLDAVGPFERVYQLDAEAGEVFFGDGEHGSIPPLVPRAGRVLARRYRHGGGVIGECGAGAIDKLAVQITGLAGVVNPVPARGGADAETLDEAKWRARKTLASRSRAVTAEDFQFIARTTPEVRVARAVVVPRRRPLSLICPPDAQPAPPVPIPAPICAPPHGSATTIALAATDDLQCGPALPPVAGLDHDFEAPGVVSVVVVPQQTGFEPLPTPSFLRAVCRWLDRHRLVTTEVHVVPPQYCRLCKVFVRVRGRPGYTRLQLQELVLARLSTHLHVLVGGADGEGAPFGGELHIAELIAQVFRTEGIDGVEELTAEFVRTRSQASPRSGRLVRCPAGPGEFERLALAPDETTSLEPASFTLATV